MGAVQVNAGQRRLGEELQFGVEIVLKVRVLNGGNVVVPNVEKGGGGKGDAQGAVVLQRLAGYLHHQIFHAGGAGVGKVPLQLQGLGGGEVGLEALHPVPGVDGRDDAAGLPLRGQVLVQDMFQVVGGGRLALGAGETDDFQMPGGVVVVFCRQWGHGPPHVLDQDAGKVRRGIGRLADVGKGPPADGVRQVLRLEVGPLTEKQGTGDGFPGVVGQKLHCAPKFQPLRQGGGQQAQLVQQGAVVPQGE